MTYADTTLAAFADALAARASTPGGGSAAAAAAAMGAGLLAMALRYSQGKKRNSAADEAQLAATLERIEAHRLALLPMADADAAAFGAVTDAYALPKSDATETATREAAIQSALVGALTVPADLLARCSDALSDFTPALELIGKNIVSDVGAGTCLLRSAGHMAMLNVRINLAFLRDPAVTDPARSRAATALAALDATAERIHAHVDGLLSS